MDCRSASPFFGTRALSQRARPGQAWGRVSWAGVGLVTAALAEARDPKLVPHGPGLRPGPLGTGFGSAGATRTTKTSQNRPKQPDPNPTCSAAPRVQRTPWLISDFPFLGSEPLGPLRVASAVLLRPAIGKSTRLPGQGTPTPAPLGTWRAWGPNPESKNQIPRMVRVGSCRAQRFFPAVRAGSCWVYFRSLRFSVILVGPCRTEPDQAGTNRSGRTCVHRPGRPGYTCEVGPGSNRHGRAR